MTKQYEKYIRNLPKQEQSKLFLVIQKIEGREFETLDVKKLKGTSDLY